MFCLILALVMFSSSHAHRFTVGGKDGWVIKPSESYSHWAQRLRFQVNDTLLFKYKKESNSVLVVHKDNYDRCNTSNPILKLNNGTSVFKFERSGPFFFISGNTTNCVDGQKLIVVVLAVRNRPHAPSPSPAQTPSPLAPPVTGPSPGGNTPADGGLPPPPRRSAAAGSIHSILLVSAVTFVLSLWFITSV